MVLQEEWTSVRVKNETHQRLLALKVHPRESFNDVIVRLLDDKPKNYVANILDEGGSREYISLGKNDVRELDEEKEK